MGNVQPEHLSRLAAGMHAIVKSDAGPAVVLSTLHFPSNACGLPVYSHMLAICRGGDKEIRPI